MLRTIAGVLFVGHGLVHILCVAQSLRSGRMMPHVRWIDGPWALSGRLRVGASRRLAAVTGARATAGRCGDSGRMRRP